MARLRIRLENEATIDDVEEALYQIIQWPVNEIPLNEILKIMDFLGVEQPVGRKGGTGSVVRFRHCLLEGHPNFTQGYFKIHIIHGGKLQRKIRKRDYVTYLIPPLLEIIKRKREESESK